MLKYLGHQSTFTGIPKKKKKKKKRKENWPQTPQTILSCTFSSLNVILNLVMDWMLSIVYVLLTLMLLTSNFILNTEHAHSQW